MRRMLTMGTCLALLTAVMATVGCSRPREARGPMKIAINVWPGYAYAFVAKEKGYFKKNGVDVDLTLKKEQSESLKLYHDGASDGLFTVLPDVLMLNSEGIPTKVVFIVDYSTTGDVIIADPKIGSIADLKGKTVSFEGVNSFSHIFVLRSLKNAGLGEASVRFRNVPAHDVLKELERGAIDAGHTWNPTKRAALEKGYKAVASAGEIPLIIVDVLAFRDNVIEERPDDVRAVVKSLLEARDFITTNKEEALSIMARAEGMSKEAMLEGLNGVIQPSLKENLEGMAGAQPAIEESIRAAGDFYITHGQFSKQFAAGEIVEPKFIEELGGESK